MFLLVCSVSSYLKEWLFLSACLTSCLRDLLILSSYWLLVVLKKQTAAMANRWVRRGILSSFSSLPFFSVSHFMSSLMLKREAWEGSSSNKLELPKLLILSWFCLFVILVFGLWRSTQHRFVRGLSNFGLRVILYCNGTVWTVWCVCGRWAPSSSLGSWTLEAVGSLS